MPTNFKDIQTILDDFVNEHHIPIASAPHRAFWRRGSTEAEQYEAFTTGDAIPGFKIMQKGDSAHSNVVLALRGQAPFDGSTFPRMPPQGPYLPDADIATIAAWIDQGAPERTEGCVRSSTAPNPSNAPAPRRSR